MKIPELLAPVGSLSHLKIAINAGASSVYLSGKEYGARKYAKNLTLDEIKKAVNTAHLHNVRVYVTVNTLIMEDELEEVINYLSNLYSIGVDAVIVQDLGLIELINKYLPNLRVHASTQMTIENQLKLSYIESKGIKRVILPREMRKEEIKKLKTNMELEIFVHGALCYSYSGQCLMSSLNGGRSGNRGTCAQPCRQKYMIPGLKEDYYLSPSDLSLYNHLKEICELNISCIKIEGRMRSKEYLAIIISNYRKALNKLKSNKTTNSEEINLVFNRGLTEGQFLKSSKRSMKAGHIGLKIGKVINSTKNQIAIKLNDNIENIPNKGDGLLLIKKNKEYGFEISQKPTITTINHFNKNKYKQIKDLTRKNKILIIKKVLQNKKFNFNLNKSDVYLTKRNELSKKTGKIENKGNSFIKTKIMLTFSVKNNYPILKATLIKTNKQKIKCEVKGKTPLEKPIKKNITIDTIRKQLLKVDNYPYEITHININYDGSLYTPLSKINELRRELFKKLEKEIINSYKHEKKKIKLIEKENEKENTESNISFYTNNLNHLKTIKNIKRVYLEIPPQSNTLNLKEEYNINYMVNFIKKAYEISLDKDYELIWKWPDICHDKLVKILNKVKGILHKMHLDLEIMSNNFNAKYYPYSTNITNTQSINSLKNSKIITLSPELCKKDYENIIKKCDTKEKLEIITQGSIEVMKSRYQLLYNNELKNIKNNYLTNKKSNYLVYKSISGEELIIINNDELSLLSKITYLKNIGYCNFSIDGRWRDDNYTKVIDIYKQALDGHINQEKLKKYTRNNTLGNY